MKKWMFLVGATALTAGCLADRPVAYVIDNPTDASVQVHIDDAVYDVPAHQDKAVSLKPGEHRLEAPATGAVKFIVYANRKGEGLINPTLSRYVVANEVYVTDASKLKNFGAIDSTVQIDGVDFRGPYTEANDLFIDKDWRFGVHEAFPDSLRGYDPGNGGNIFRKIFTEHDFIAFYEGEHGQPGYFESHRQHGAATPPHLSPEPTLPDFADPVIQGASMKLRETYRQYLHATDPAQQKQCQEAYSKETMEFVGIVADKLGNQPVDENKKYNRFIELTGRVFGTATRIEG